MRSPSPMTVVSTPRWRSLRPCIASVLILSLSSLLFAATPQPTEYQVKAAYLFNFARFVKWPGNVPAIPSDTFPICVLGRDPFGPVLDSTVAGESIDGKRVVVHRIASPREAFNCRVVYISSSEDSRLKSVLSGIQHPGVLTVSDMPNFHERGGMIHFVVHQSRVRFYINLAAASSAGLTISSELLKVAVAVTHAPAGDR